VVAAHVAHETPFRHVHAHPALAARRGAVRGQLGCALDHVFRDIPLAAFDDHVSARLAPRVEPQVVRPGAFEPVPLP
jgi:hypothetical protein